MRRSLACVGIACGILAHSVPARAEDPPWVAPVVVPISKGKPAPFDGVLLTTEAAAKIVAHSQACDERTAIEVERAKSEQKARDDKRLADAAADAEHVKAVLEASLHAREADLSAMTKRLEEAEKAKDKIWMWGVGGLIAGAAVSIITIFVVSTGK